MHQNAEAVAGPVSNHELTRFGLPETGKDTHARLWLRGGFPDSYLASSDGDSLQWREDFRRTCLERDIPAFGLRAAAETLRRLWTMLAHSQGGLLNAAKRAGSFGVSGQTVDPHAG